MSGFGSTIKRSLGGIANFFSAGTDGGGLGLFGKPLGEVVQSSQPNQAAAAADQAKSGPAADTAKSGTLTSGGKRRRKGGGSRTQTLLSSELESDNTLGGG